MGGVHDLEIETIKMCCINFMQGEETAEQLGFISVVKNMREGEQQKENNKTETFDHRDDVTCLSKKYIKFRMHFHILNNDNYPNKTYNKDI